MDAWNPKSMGYSQFIDAYRGVVIQEMMKPKVPPCEVEFGVEKPAKGLRRFKRDGLTGLFDDQQMVDALCSAMNDPISNFGPQNVPNSLKAVEIAGILQARKWEVGTLNDFREFFGMNRHETFEEISQNKNVADALVSHFSESVMWCNG